MDKKLSVAAPYVQMNNYPLIAVVAMSGVFPAATGIQNFWSNICAKVDATSDIPPGIWPAPMNWVYDPSPDLDKTYSRRACLVRQFKFEPHGLNLETLHLKKLDLLHQWVLHAAADAMQNCHLDNIDKKRMGVILAAIALPTASASLLSQRVLGNHILATLSMAPRRNSKYGYTEAFCDRVVSSPAAIIADVFGMGGQCYTLDAACASSLYAVKLACDELQKFRSDAMLTGGVSAADGLYTQIGFSQLKALSASGRCAPFDHSADGLVVGEGAGIMILKRLQDAISDGDTIFGVIRGIGLSNDMRGNLLAPESAGQVRAMQSAYKQAQWQPQDVDYIECHGAGTPIGDATEMQSLKTIWQTNGPKIRPCALGSVKSMIGHLLTGAGAAGMIKTLLALHHQTLPPSLNFEKAPADSPLNQGLFKVQTEAEPWPARDRGMPRRAAVSAFGFGGINAHLLLEEWLPDCADNLKSIYSINPAKPNQRSAQNAQDDSVAIVGMAIHMGPLTSLEDFQQGVFHGRSGLIPPPSQRWKASHALKAIFGLDPALGGFIDQFSVELGEFQIPPGEIPEILPQQLLMLKVGACAMRDAHMPLKEARKAMGTVIGIGFDYEATNFHLRWALPQLADQWQSQFGLTLDSDKLADWLREAKAQCGPPLTPSRTVGALGGIVASRIAREFRLGGPSFVISAEEASGLQAVEIARQMLQSHETDAMLVGAVDLHCDERNLATIYSRMPLSPKGRLRPFDQDADGTLPGEGAVALVLKRLSDAQSAGDRIYAIIEGYGSAHSRRRDDAGSMREAYCSSLQRAFSDAGISSSTTRLMETHGSGVPAQDDVEIEALNQFFVPDISHPQTSIALSALKPLVGHCGAASGLASLAKAAICLYHQIIAPLPGFVRPRQPNLLKDGFYIPRKASYWSRDRIDGPRRGCVATITLDGNCAHILLRQHEKTAGETARHHDRRKIHPLGDLPYGLFLLKGRTPEDLLLQLGRLERLAGGYGSSASVRGLADFARRWHHQQDDVADVVEYCLAMVSTSWNQFRTQLAEARRVVEKGSPCRPKGRGGICYLPRSGLDPHQLAFVYPGSGNHYVGMGRTLGTYWPEVLQAMDSATDRLQSQMLPEWYDPWRSDWQEGWQAEAYNTLSADPLRTIFGQVLFAGQMTGLLQKFHVIPRAVIGYSLGESAGLFALGAWPDRGQMLERLEASNLFKTQLAGSCDAVRQAWRIPPDQPLQWRAAVVNRPVDHVDAAISDFPCVRRLIINTPDECVIGGDKDQVAAAIQKMRCEAVHLDGVVAVHCDVALPVAQAYEALHRFATTTVADLQFYSCAWGRAYDLSSDAAAQSILDQAIRGFDFPATIRQAYADGVRIFLEIGPHTSCTRMIGRILEGQPHLALAANSRNEDEGLTLLKCLAGLAATGVPLNLDPLYGLAEEPVPGDIPAHRQTIQITIGGRPLAVPPLPESLPDQVVPSEDEFRPLPPFSHFLTDNDSAKPRASSPTTDFGDLIEEFNQTVAATAQAHEQFLQFSRELTTQLGQSFELQSQLMQTLQATSGNDKQNRGTPAPAPPKSAFRTDASVAFNRTQCLEFAIGTVGRVLGPRFDIIDTYPARVRLPDEPLMLVDRILRVEGEMCSLGPGSLVTEHDVLPAAWYLDGGRAPVCISVEAGQADLFLSSYLGIDHVVKGQRTYRLLDARIRFHRGLPRPGETIRYTIHIDKFVRQGETYLFFFHFEGHIGDQHLITMTDGCAGFFTEAEVRNSGGIILSAEDLSPGARINGSPYAEIVPLTNESYNDAQIEALRQGDIGCCFGADFQGIQLPQALCLPSGRMRLIHRVLNLEPRGGRFGLGYVKAETDINPQDWFLTCHFVDDMVMPGTLMYECCAHTLRVLLLRLGWLCLETEVCYEPVPGVACRLKCRGPVTPQTRRVHYAVEIKEIGYHPEPYVIADAHMHADGHYIVFFKDMSMQMTGLNQERVAAFWQDRTQEIDQAQSLPEAIPKQAQPLFNRDHILEFAVGSPSKAFGKLYRPFDQHRRIARLPGPPYCFMDRVVSVEPRPWALEPGGWIEAQYDVPAEAWYFKAESTDVMPFCVLLEIALQPCGWLAAFAGSALKSEKDLKFRNLGGRATQHANIRALDQTLTMRARLTKVSEAVDMIIEHFDFEVLGDGHPLYTGTTYFGFFTEAALSQQVGMREPAYRPEPDDLAISQPHVFSDSPPLTPDEASSQHRNEAVGLTMPAKALRMIDGIEVWSPAGGPAGLGFIRAYKRVDPQEWFFKAHFFQDPVCPGSLGIESFLQTLKFAAMRKWPQYADTHVFESLCTPPHQWSYRGQVVPTNQKVVVETVIKRAEDGPQPIIIADGWLQVDGLYIYKMEDFGIRLSPKYTFGLYY